MDEVTVEVRAGAATRVEMIDLAAADGIGHQREDANDGPARQTVHPPAVPSVVLNVRS
jgi:hypothetical protein